MNRLHNYKLSIKWSGNKGLGTSDYSAFDRDYSVEIEHKPILNGSADPTFRGDKTKFNPEDMLLASLSACHMLSYLHLCSVGGIVVIDYYDHATATMETRIDGGGQFTEVTLNPLVTVTDASMIDKALALHKRAGEVCFIANSVNFQIKHFPVVITSETNS
ncbi:OsmC family protein [Dyadobacter frigoris]|uniref:OsmC family peroxiredoxin n=1 Tax=Dyadobacter frigoris TaxID=2576211 RepID=A0A4U6CKH6_9BACT|nr:OsmC family protein [Dyadobacter frigoris]TKT84719.1 OsmC family peroxiredoxin [Dyadobacter frigoris]